MKKILSLIISLLFPIILSAPVYAEQLSPPQVSSHPGFFSSHRSHGSIAGTAANTSENWSGYAVTGTSGAYNSVSSSWTQPKLNCAALSENSYSAYWVGLDGFSDQTVEQIGTEANCLNNQASYSAWYEMYPSNPYEVQLGLTINPGDQISANVSYNPSTVTKVPTFHGRTREVITNASYSLSINDNTTGKSFTSTLSPRQTYQRSSAEVITEAPYSNGVLPLADYITTSYTKSLVNGSPIGSAANLQDIIMQNPAGMTSIPSAFDSTNENFTVNWSNN